MNSMPPVGSCSRWSTEHQSKYRWWKAAGCGKRKSCLSSSASPQPPLPAPLEPVQRAADSSLRPPFHTYRPNTSNALVPRLVRMRRDEDCFNRITVDAAARRSTSSVAGLSPAATGKLKALPRQTIHHHRDPAYFH